MLQEMDDVCEILLGIESHTTTVCRCCFLDESDIRPFSEELQQKFQLLTSLNVGKYDQRLEVICGKCRDKVNDFYEFRNECIRSDALLKDIVTDWLTSLGGDSLEQTIQIVEDEKKVFSTNEEQIIKVEENENHDAKEADQQRRTMVLLEMLNNDLVIENSILKMADVLETECQKPNRYSCHVCHKRFRLKSYLQKHMKRHRIKAEHGNESIEESALGEKSLIKIEVLNCKPIYQSGGHENLILDEPIQIDEGIQNAETDNDISRDLTSRSNNGADQNILINTENDILGENSEYSCEICGICFLSKYLLVNHTKRHKEKVEFKCDICGKIVKDKLSLKRHELIHSDVKPYNCDLCSRGFVQKPMYRVHMLKSHCIVIPKSLAAANKRSGKESQSQQCYSCNTCGKNFQRKRYLLLHQQAHTVEEIAPCQFCGQTLKDKYRRKLHALRHQGIFRYECTHCQKRFLEISQLNAHLEIHAENKQFACQFCEKWYTTKSRLDFHLRGHTLPESCKLCDQRFRQKKDVETHVIRVHQGGDIELTHQCDACGKTFNSQTSLSRHQRVHANVKPYKCEYCGKGFTVRGAMQIHVRTHTGEKPESKVSCGICGKGCATNSQLKIHTRFAHSDERPYECNACGLRFKLSIHLSSHKLRHTGERPYPCGKCSAAFRQNSTRKKHWRTIHKMSEDSR